jgi:hypothetical protein
MDVNDLARRQIRDGLQDASLARRGMRWVRRPFDDEPPRELHALDDGRCDPLRQAPIELRPQVPAQHLLGSPGNRPFGAFGVGQSVGIGHVSIGEQDWNGAQAIGGCAQVARSAGDC